VSQDLFDLYSLNEIASSVARTLPNGEKNKLRKTYKGKIKDLGISGKFDVTARDIDAPDGLLAMIRHPEEEWAIQNRQGKEIENGLGQAIRANLAMAMTMSKGTVPKSQWDSSVLGELDLPESKASTAPVAAKSMAPGVVQKGLNASAVQQGKGKAEIARPKRNLKKRGYDESSFEGYGEGYVDDDMADAGYSTAEGDDRGMSQKRRKKVGIDDWSCSIMTDDYQGTTSHGYQGPIRHNSYGPGMVGA
jgi:Rox3 mediator complex subunit